MRKVLTFIRVITYLLYTGSPSHCVSFTTYTQRGKGADLRYSHYDQEEVSERHIHSRWPFESRILVRKGTSACHREADISRDTILSKVI